LGSCGRVADSDGASSPLDPSTSDTQYSERLDTAIRDCCCYPSTVPCGPVADSCLQCVTLTGLIR
jgi:hypothetical protein